MFGKLITVTRDYMTVSITVVDELELELEFYYLFYSRCGVQIHVL